METNIFHKYEGLHVFQLDKGHHMELSLQLELDWRLQLEPVYPLSLQLDMEPS